MTEPPARLDSVDGVVVDAVSKRFDATPVLAGLSLTVARGEFVSIIGPSGCGKSTLLRLMAGLLQPDRGSISIFGESVSRALEQKHIGLVPQSPALLPWRTVLENVELPLEINRRVTPTSPEHDPARILAAFGLGAVLHRLPHELSGGMAQRVAVARAFVFEPSLLLMDEPFSALDELTREKLRYELLQRCQETPKTVCFVTHSVTEAVLLSDRVVVLSAHPAIEPVEVPVRLTRPRGEDIELTDDFREIERAVRRALRSGVQPTDA